MKRFILTCLLALCFNVQAEEWTTQQKWLLAGAMTLHVIDWGQTRTIALNPDKFYERNPILGTHPSLGRVNTHFAIGLVGLPLLAHYVPSIRNYLLWSWGALELGMVANNYHIGIRATF